MSYRPTLSEFQNGPHPIPLVKRLPWSLTTPLEAFERIARPPYGFLLESVKGSPITARYSFVGSEPFLVIRSKGKQVERIEGRKREVLYQDPMILLKDLLQRYAVPRPKDVPPLFGGVVGYFGYELVQFFEKVPTAEKDEPGCPDLYLLFVDTVLVFDHAEQALYLIHCPSTERFLKEDRKSLYQAGLERLAEIEQRLFNPVPRQRLAVRRSMRGTPQSNFTKERYIEMIRACKEYIAAGDIYQANLSQRFTVEFGKDPWELYQTLRWINPSPFAAFLQMEDLFLVSASPERLVRLQNGIVETRPIAGTRPRGTAPEEDEKMRSALLANEKERAEHIMLVDLERSDLGRVSAYGSVKVDELMTTEAYSHVIHIVSNVHGRLAPEKSALDVIRAAFPGGTITGVPKVRCMEIIAELEPVRRGPYTGSIGYISFSGEMDLNIVIRTFIIDKGKTYIQVGGGIVADSDPDQEYHETLYKAQALLSALEALS